MESHKLIKTSMSGFVLKRKKEIICFDTKLEWSWLIKNSSVYFRL